MKKFLLAALLSGALLGCISSGEAAVSMQEQNLGRAVIHRPVVEGLQEDSLQQVEQDLDRMVCILTEEVTKKNDVKGSFDFQVMADKEFYVSLLLRASVAGSKEKDNRETFYGVLYEKNHGKRVLLQDMLGVMPTAEQINALCQRDGVTTLEGQKIPPAECGKIKQVPENFVLDETEKLYLVFQPGELAPAERGAVLLLIAVQ